MKKLYLFSYLASIALFFLLFSPSLSAQEVLYYESFSQGIPDTYRVVDVDGLVVHPNIDSSSFEDLPFDGGWVTRTNFDNPEDTVAASSSWYEPPGISDDWLITPQISIPADGSFFLQWRAANINANFRDGYEVYISTTGSAVGDFIDTAVFAIEEELAIWVTRKVSLADYAGEDIYIGFRNNSDDKFLLFLDDIYIADEGATVNGDPAILGSEFPDIYTSGTLGQLDTFLLSATMTNLGTETLEDSFSLTSVIFDPFPDNPIFAQSLEGPTAPFGALEVGTFVGEPAFVPVDTGLHIVTYLISSIDQDTLPENDFTAEVFDNDFDFQVIEVSDSVLARDDANFTTIWDVPAGDNQESILGSVYNLLRADVLTSATVFLFPFAENIGDEIVAQVYNDSLQLVAQSDSYTIVDEDTTGGGIRLNLSFAQGSVNKTAAPSGVSLDPGAFLLAVKGGEFLPVLMSSNIFFDGGTFFTWDSLAMDGGWFTTEDLKPILDSLIIQQGGNALFNAERVLGIRANLAGCGALSGELVVVDDDGSGNGSVAVVPSGGQAPYSYAWSDTQPRPETDSLLTGLSDGRYSVVLTDNRGCETFLLAVIGLGTSTRDPLEIGLNNFSAYPNPAISMLNVDFSLEKPDDVQISLLDIQGRVLNTQLYKQTLSVKNQIPTSNWASGIYLLRVQTSKGILYKRVMLK